MPPYVSAPARHASGPETAVPQSDRGTPHGGVGVPMDALAERRAARTCPRRSGQRPSPPVRAERLCPQETSGASPPPPPARARDPRPASARSFRPCVEGSARAAPKAAAPRTLLPSTVSILWSRGTSPAGSGGSAPSAGVSRRTRRRGRKRPVPPRPCDSRPEAEVVPSAPRMTSRIGSTTFGNPASRPLARLGPVALRPSLSAGLPLSCHRSERGSLPSKSH